MFGGPLEFKFKLLANAIIFPDERFKENTLAGLADRLQHSIIKIFPISIKLHARVANQDRSKPGTWNTPLRAIAFAPEVDSDQRPNHQELQAQQCQQRSQCPPTQ